MQRYSRLILNANLILASVLRLNHIDQPLVDAFSWRQASTAMMAHNFFHHGWNIFMPAVHWNGPQLSYQGREFQTVSYLTALLYAFFGQHEVLGRLVALSFGVWGVYALYQLTKRVWDEPKALAASAMLAVLPGAVFIDRSFLPDPAMVALSTTTLWMWVAYLQTNKRSYLILTAIIGMWAIASKLPGAIIALPAVYAAFAILGYKEVLRPNRLRTFVILTVVVLVPVACYYLWVRELALKYPPYHFAGSRNWIWWDGPLVWWERGYYLQDIYKIAQKWLWTPPIMVLAGLGVILAPIFHMEDKDTSAPRKAPWLFHWWLVGCGFYYLIGARELFENVWNLHIFNPVAAAFAGQAIMLLGWFGERVSRSTLPLTRVAIAMAITLVWTQASLSIMYVSYAQDGYELGMELRRLSAPDELVATVTNDIGDPVAIYYSGRRGWVFPPADPDKVWNQLPEDDTETIALFEQLYAQGVRWFGFVRHFDKASWDGHERFFTHLNQRCDYKAGGPNSRIVICSIR